MPSTVILFPKTNKSYFLFLKCEHSYTLLIIGLTAISTKKAMTLIRINSKTASAHFLRNFFMRLELEVNELVFTKSAEKQKA